MILKPHARGGKAGIREISEQYMNGFFVYIGENGLTSSCADIREYLNIKKESCSSLVMCGELSPADRALLSHGLALITEETLQKLKMKDPSRRVVSQWLAQNNNRYQCQQYL